MPPSKQQPLSDWKPQKPVDGRALVFSIWRKAYRQKYNAPYLGSSAADANIANQVYKAAQEAAAAEAEERGGEVDTQPLHGEAVQHWVDAYLADDGYWLEQNRHPLRGLARDLQKYGFPPSWRIGGGSSGPNYDDLNNYGG